MFFWLEGAVYTGTIPAIAIGFLVVETITLLYAYRRFGRSALIVANAFAGGSVMVALYILATGGPALLVAGLLVVSLVAHATDLVLRHPLITQPQRPGSSAKHAD
ncbi:MAG: hypothetical protein AAFP99_03780 [Pseudomonadota bacterium]